MANVYPFTNENLTSYKDLYKFDNARVLSVLGSGDQYFSSILYGAKEVELYDCNFLAWDFFVLKFYGILTLNYEEFYNLFVKTRLEDLKCLKKLLEYLPKDVANRIAKLQKDYRWLSRLLYIDYIGEKYNNGRCIPYFDKKTYYQLQSLLREQQLPKFYLSYLQSMPSMVDNKSYDVILTSNIFDWMYGDMDKDCVLEYKKLLNKFNYGEIQALYHWTLTEELQSSLEQNGFEIESVPASRVLSLSNDWVASLRKR